MHYEHFASLCYVAQQTAGSIEVTNVEQWGKVTLTMLCQHTMTESACTVNELCPGTGQGVIFS